MAPPPSAASNIYLWALISGIERLNFQVVQSVFCMCVAVCVCERVKEFVVWFRIAPSLDAVTALHRRQAPYSYMQVTVVAPQSLASNDRKPRDQASRRGRLSACEERTEPGEKRRAEEPSPLP